MANHYLIHLPHYGVEIPTEYLGDYLLTKEELQENIYEYADLYTDKLFDDLYKQFGGVKNKYSRLFFDPERFFDDECEEMQKKYALGWFYENSILDKKPLRSIKNKEAISKYYIQHHQELNMKTQAKLDKYGKCTIIDCHSFSNRKYWFHDEEFDLPDICIGYEDFHKDQELVDMIIEQFKEYDIQINKPYSGSLVPNDYYKKNPNVKSVMIEINKKLYLDNNTVLKDEFLNIKKKITNLGMVKI